MGALGSPCKVFYKAEDKVSCFYSLFDYTQYWAER